MFLRMKLCKGQPSRGQAAARVEWFGHQDREQSVKGVAGTESNK